MNFMATNNFIKEIPAIKVWTEKRIVFLELVDGRIIGFPADRFKILKKATENELNEVQ